VSGAGLTDVSPIDYSYQEMLSMEYEGIMSVGSSAAPFYLGQDLYVDTEISGCLLSEPIGGFAEHPNLEATLRCLNASNGGENIYQNADNVVVTGDELLVEAVALSPSVMRIELPAEMAVGLWELLLPMPTADCLIIQEFVATTRYRMNSTFASNFVALSSASKQQQMMHFTELVFESFSSNTSAALNADFNDTAYYALPYVRDTMASASAQYSNATFAILLAETWKSLDVAAEVYSRRELSSLGHSSGRRLQYRGYSDLVKRNRYTKSVDELDKAMTTAEKIIRLWVTFQAGVVAAIGQLLMSINKNLADELIPLMQEELDEINDPVQMRRAVRQLQQRILVCGPNVLDLPTSRESFNLHREGPLAGLYPGLVASANNAWDHLRPRILSVLPAPIFAFVGGDSLVTSVDSVFTRGAMTTGVLPSESVVSVTSSYDNLCASSGSSTVFCDCAGSSAYQTSPVEVPLSIALTVRYLPAPQLDEREWTDTAYGLLTARTGAPSAAPTAAPSPTPTAIPTTAAPTFSPTARPTVRPSANPTELPTARPTAPPTMAPTFSAAPTMMPSRYLSSTTCLNPLYTCPMYWYQYDVCSASDATVSTTIYCANSIEGETVWVDRDGILNGNCVACTSSADCGGGAICSSIGNSCSVDNLCWGWRCVPTASCTGEARIGGEYMQIP